MLRIAKLFFSILAVGCVLFFMWDTREITGEILFKADLQLLPYSVLLWTSIHFVAPLFSVAIFRSLSEQLSYHDAFRIHARRLPAKYLPGGIWHSVARIEGYRRNGIRTRHIALYLLIENLSAAGMTLLLGGAIVYFLIPSQPFLTMAILGSMIASTIVMVMLPWVINRKMLSMEERLVLKPYLHGIAVQLLFWCGASLSFYAFIEAVIGRDMEAEALQVMGVYLFSWGVGFITLIAPQGLGVSEYVASLLLPHGMESIVIISLLAGFRVVVLFGDILAWLIALLPFRLELLRKILRN